MNDTQAKRRTRPDTRTRLVLTSMRLFWEKGYGSTSIADVLQAARVNSGSLYHFFPGKQDLLLAVLDLYLAGIREMLLEPAWRGVDDPIERIFALLARYRCSLTDTECTYGCPIGSLALELHEPDLAVRERLAANFTAWIDAIEECLNCRRRAAARATASAASWPPSCSRPWKGASCRRAPTGASTISTAPCASCAPTSSNCCARRTPPAAQPRTPQSKAERLMNTLSRCLALAAALAGAGLCAAPRSRRPPPTSRWRSWSATAGAALSPAAR